MSGAKRTKQTIDERAQRKIFIPKTNRNRRAHGATRQKGKALFDWRKMLDEYREEEEEEDYEYDDTNYKENGYVEKEGLKEEDGGDNNNCDEESAAEKDPNADDRYGDRNGDDKYEANERNWEDIIVVQRHIVDMRVVFVGDGIIVSKLEEEVRKRKKWTRKEILKKKANGYMEVVEVKEYVNESYETGLLSSAVWREKRIKMEDNEEHEHEDEDATDEEVDDKEELRKWLEEERKRLKEEEQEDEIHFGIAMCCFD